MHTGVDAIFGTSTHIKPFYVCQAPTKVTFHFKTGHPEDKGAQIKRYDMSRKPKVTSEPAAQN